MKTKFGPRIAVGLVLILAPMPIYADSQLVFRRHWDKCILQSNSKVHFDMQEARYYTEGISQNLTDQIDETVRQELSRHFALNDPDSDLDFFYKAEPRGNVLRTALIVIGFCKRGQPRDMPANCTNTNVISVLTPNLSFTEFMREALRAEIAHLLRPECTNADLK